MLDNEKNLATENAAENVGNATEEAPKTYTEAEFNAKLDEVLGKKIARTRAKIEKEYEKKYGELETVLKAGMGKEDIGEITGDLRKFYTVDKKIAIPDKPQYSAKDISTLARAEADEIIRSGFDEVVEEVDRLAEIGVENMTDREKAVFKALAEHRQNAERSKELAKIGVSEDVYNSKEFQSYASKFKSDIPITEVYENYAKTQPKKEFKIMGSMKSTATDDKGVKDFYSYEEAQKFSVDDFNKNPKLYEAVKSSMTKW